MLIYQPLNGSMLPINVKIAKSLTYVKFVNTAPQEGMIFPGSPILHFPDGKQYCTIDIVNSTYVFLLQPMNYGGQIHIMRVEHISKLTKKGFETVDGGPNLLTPAYQKHINSTLAAKPLLIEDRYNLSFVPYVIAWILLALATKLCGISGYYPVLQAVLIDLCTNCFKFRRIYLDRQIHVAVGVFFTRRLMMSILPSYVHAITWLAVFHYHATPCLIVSGVCFADYVALLVVRYAHYAGKLVYVLIAVALGFIHDRYPKFFLPLFTVVSACVIAHLHGLHPRQLVEVAGAAMNATMAPLRLAWPW